MYNNSCKEFNDYPIIQEEVFEQYDVTYEFSEIPPFSLTIQYLFQRSNDLLIIL